MNATAGQQAHGPGPSPEPGLGEQLLDGYAAFVADLRSVLDVEAGLREILGGGGERG